MDTTITVKVPESLKQQLEPFHDRLPEILERGIYEARAEESGQSLNESEIMLLLASRPTQEQILAIKVSPELQERVSLLLSRNKQGQLSYQEEAELNHYAAFEHLLRLAKAQAFVQLTHKK